MNRLAIFVTGLLLALMVAFSTLFIVDQRQFAVIYALGEIKSVVTEPGFFRGTGMVFARMGYTMGGERIALPLADDGESGDGIIGGTYYTALPRPADDPPQGPDFTREQVAFFPLDPA